VSISSQHAIAALASTEIFNVFSGPAFAHPVGSLAMNPAADSPVEIEPALIRRVASGDVAAFEELYRLASGLLFSVALRMLQRHEDAEELIQEVFVKLWKDAATYDPRRGAPLAWALTITRHKAIDRIRSTTRRIRLHDEAEREAQHAEPAGASAEPASETLHAESASAVRTSLDGLPQEVRKTVELAYFGGLSQSQIAEKLSVPLTTVKSHIRRAMTTLRHSLKEFA
jgi:RNA polymerase sigma-70 factor (ECF subfamily)